MDVQVSGNGRKERRKHAYYRIVKRCQDDENRDCECCTKVAFFPTHVLPLCYNLTFPYIILSYFGFYTSITQILNISYPIIKYTQRGKKVLIYFT